jgi:hypothetical protein
MLNKVIWYKDVTVNEHQDIMLGMFGSKVPTASRIQSCRRLHYFCFEIRQITLIRYYYQLVLAQLLFQLFVTMQCFLVPHMHRHYE